MIYLDYIEQYCKKYKLKLHHDGRLGGTQLLSTQFLVHNLKIHFHCSFQTIADNLGIHRQSAMLFYYTVLGNSIYRKNAEERWKKINNARDIQTIG